MEPDRDDSEQSPGKVAAGMAVGRAKACVLCRQQKVKCDAFQKCSMSCSRCTKAGVPCTFSSTFERRKRRSKAVLQRELDELRNQHAQSQFASISQSPPSQRDLRHSAETTDSMPLPAVTEGSTAGPTPAIAYNPSSAAYEGPPTPGRTTSGRSLDGIFVEGFKIEDCYTSFFKHYHPVLPILDSTCDPDTCYQRSPLVFWSVVITGSRRYDLDPTLLERLGTRVTQLAVSSLAQVTSYFTTISGLLILCTWPLPMKTMFEDPTPTYCGAAMQLALQSGLHMFSRKQEFSRSATSRDFVPYGEISRAQDVSRLRLWAYLEFVCHCTNFTTGLPLHCVTDAFDLGQGDRAVMKSLPPSIYWMQKFEKALLRSIKSLTEISSGVNGEVSSDVIFALSNHFEDQILEINRDALDDLNPTGPFSTPRTDVSVLPNPLVVTLARLHIKAFYFLASDVSSHLANMIELFHLACSWIEQAMDMDRVSDWATYCSESYFRTIMLVAAMILRVCRSHQLKSMIDRRLGERSYFAAVKLLRRRSLQPNDVNAYTATALSGLWHSDHCFKRQDGVSDSLYVRIRGRGAMGVVFDCLWSWQQEDHQPVHEKADFQEAGCNSIDLPSFDSGSSNHNVLELPRVDDNWFPSLLNDASLNFLPESQWATEAIFWT